MRVRFPLWLTGVVLLVAVLGCDTPSKPPPYSAVASVKQLMASIVEPAADNYWDAVGSTEDSTGITTHYPRSPEAWTLVRNSAYIVTESGNLLMMAPRARDQGDWMTLSRAMVDVGRKSIAAADARDTAAVFNAGAELYDACTNCHARYSVGNAPPSPR